MTTENVKKSPKRATKLFVLEGENDMQDVEREPAILETACNWRIVVDLPGVVYNFSSHIAITGERPDLVLWSESLKLVILNELTVPSECSTKEAYARKSEKYGKPVACATKSATEAGRWT